MWVPRRLGSPADAVAHRVGVLVQVRLGAAGAPGQIRSWLADEADLAATLLPAEPGAYPLTFTTDRSQFPSLLGMPVEGMFGPDVDINQIIYSEGWGLDGQGAALIFIAQNDDRFYWHGLIFSSEHFDKG